MINKEAYALGTHSSGIRDLFEYGRARAARVGEENVFDFSLGNPSIPAPPQVKMVIQNILEESEPLAIHSYTSAAGDLETRQAIAEDLNARFGAAITPDELFVGSGAAMELVAVFRALAVPGAEILAVAPYFPEYKPFVEQAGATFRAVAPDIPDFQLPLDELEEAIGHNTVAVIINSPNNPAGTVYTRKTLEALAKLLKRKSDQVGHPIYIVSDEPYRELVYDGAETPFIPAIYPDTVICYSYSKSLSLPGERIGYICVPAGAADSKALFAAIAGAARAAGHVCAPSLMQKVIARCASVRPDLQAYDKNRRTLYEGLLAAGYEVAKPDGAFYMFVKAPGGDAVAFSEKAKEKDLLIVPGDSFGCPGYFRLCYCVKLDTIQRSLPVFRLLLE